MAKKDLRKGIDALIPEYSTVIPPKDEQMEPFFVSSPQPVSAKKQKRIITSMAFDPDLHKRIKLFAASRDKTVKEVVAEATIAYLKAHKA